MKKVISIILAVCLSFCLMIPAFAADGEKPFENSCFYTNGDYTLHYRVYDVENEINRIMLLHGFGLSSASFEGIAAEYNAAGYDVVTVDMPNFGYSSVETASTALQSREDLTFALMQELGDKWIIGGHSMGGGIAANVAAEHPDVVTGLVLFAPQVSNEANPTASKLVSNVIMRAMFNIIIKIGVRIPGIMKLLVAMSFSDKDYAKTYDTSRISAPLLRDGVGAGITIMSSHTRGLNKSAFDALTIPVVIITCSNDKVAQASMLEPLTKSECEKLTVINVEKGGHMMFEYNPSQIADLTLPTMALAN